MKGYFHFCFQCEGLVLAACRGDAAERLFASSFARRCDAARVDETLCFIAPRRKAICALPASDQFTVLRVTREIKDPATGAVLRKLTTNVGVIKATDVDDISAVCSPVSGSDFKVGDTIKTVMQ